MNYDRGRARKFLMDFFSDEELANLCFDYFPLVYNEFTTGMPKSQKVRLLIEACQRNGRMPDLLAALERERPNLYHDHFATAPPAPLPTSQPTERNPRQIFISHAHQDADFADRLAQDLSDRGWDIWKAPDAIRPGEKWVEAINRGLAESGVFVLVLTEAAANSRWVQSETNAAINMEHRGELDFLPLEVESVAAPPLWQGYQWISFRDDYKKGLENLLQALQPDEMALLSQLYRQLQEAVGRNDWNKAQILGENILDQYPDYRETRQLIAQAKEEVKRQELLREEAAQLYRRLQVAIGAEAWDDASGLVVQIQERVQNYRNVARLATMVQQKRRQQRRRAWTQQLVNLERLPVWGWVLLLVPLAVLGLLLWTDGEGGGSGGEQPTLTDGSLPISEILADDPNVPPSTQGAELGQVVTAEGIGANNEPVEVTNTFSSSQDFIYLVAVADYIEEGTTLFARWSRDSEPFEDSTAITADRDYTDTYVEFHLENLQDRMEPGDYSVQLFVNGNPVETVDFTVAEAGDTWTRPLDDMVMVYVPPPDEPFVLESGVDAPRDGYWIDKYEVSNAQYQMCVDAGKCEPSRYADEEQFNGDYYPVSGVSWFDAADYSTWVGGELPTEGEWEYAAVGNSGTDYPWGDDFDGTLLNFCDANCSFGWKNADWDDGYELTAPVGSYPAGESWVGAADMAGNVWEWTASWYGEVEDLRVVRGGSWYSNQSSARAAYRNLNHPNLRNYNLGFRLVVRRPPSP